MLETEFKKLNFSVLGKKSNLEGSFNFDGDTIINGSLKGTITMVNESKITFERESCIEAQLYCHDVEIFGSFSGSINASGTLIVRSSAELSGKIKAHKLSIYPGAQVNMEGETLLCEEKP